MPDPAERFIEAAVRPLEDHAELRVAAEAELRSLISRHPGGPRDGWTDAAGRLENSARRWPRWKVALYACAALASVLLGAYFARDRHLLLAVADSMEFTPVAKPERRFAGEVSPEEWSFLFGDTQETTASARFKALWDRDPQKSAHFAEYAAHHWIDHGELPPAFSATAALLDPQNAWFILFEASDLAKSSVQRGPIPLAEQMEGRLPVLSITDEYGYREALELMRRAAKQPRCTSYQGELAERRLLMLAVGGDLPGRIRAQRYLAQLPSSFPLQPLADAVAARAGELAAEGDRDAFTELIADWETCLTVWLEDGSARVTEGLELKKLLQSSAAHFEAAAQTLGMTDEVQRWGEIARRLLATMDGSAAHPDHKGGWKYGSFNSPILSRSGSPMPPLSHDELMPGRLAEREFLNRLASPVVWLVLAGAAVAAAVFPLRCGLPIRRLSTRMEALLHPVDWLWIVGGGILSPLAFHQIACRITPWRGQDWGVARSSLPTLAGQWIAVTLLMLVMPLLIARWRLRVRAGKLGVSGMSTTWAWIGVATGIVAIPVFGAMGADLALPGWNLLVVLVAVALEISGRAVFGRREHLLRRATLSRMLTPAYAVGMLLIAATVPIVHRAERHWVSQDQLAAIPPDPRAVVRYEYEVNRLMKEELREVLKPYEAPGSDR